MRLKKAINLAARFARRQTDPVSTSDNRIAKNRSRWPPNRRKFSEKGNLSFLLVGMFIVFACPGWWAVGIAIDAWSGFTLVPTHKYSGVDLRRIPDAYDSRSTRAERTKMFGRSPRVVRTHDLFVEEPLSPFQRGVRFIPICAMVWLCGSVLVSAIRKSPDSIST